MANINLLPWRETQRAQRKKEFLFQIVGIVIATALGLLYWYMYVQQMIDHQNSRNAYIRAEIAVVDKKIEEIKDIEKRRAQLIARMNVIQDLQISRPQIVHLFDELVSTIPEGSYLVDLS